jgi:hypothetical protein
VRDWVDAYERAWRARDNLLRESPSRRRSSSRPYEVVACQDPVGVVRADVRYGDPVEQEYADLRLVTFDTGVAQRASRSGPSGPTHRLSQLSSLTPGSDHRSLVPRHPQARHD